MNRMNRSTRPEAIELTAIVQAALAVKEAGAEPLQAALGTALRRTGRSAPMDSFEGQLERGPFERAQLHVNTNTGLAILSLAPRPEIELLESDLDFQAFGTAPPALDVNVNVPPEGTIAYLFGPPERRLHLVFTARTKRLRTVAVHFAAKAGATAGAQSAPFARQSNASTEVRRCARCGEAELICARAWTHSGRADVITRDCVCQHCGARVRLHDPARIRALRLTAWLMIWALLPTPILLLMAQSRRRAWERNPLVPGAPYPAVRNVRPEPSRRCGACGQTARAVSITRHRTNGVPAGTDVRYLCDGCAASFEVKGGMVFSLILAPLFLAGGIACLLLATDWLTRFLGGPLIAVIGLGLGGDSLRSLRAAVRNPKIK
jgi:hypothetical protein